MTERNYFQEGYDALLADYEGGFKTHTSNPYPEGSTEHEQWESGWDTFDDWLNYGQYQ